MVKMKEMKLKDRIACDVAWRALNDFCFEHGKPASAGELAGELGIHRATALVRIKQMLWQKAIEKHCTQRGNVKETRYAPVGMRFPLSEEN